MKKMQLNNFTLGCVLAIVLCLTTSSLLAQLQPQAIREINLLTAEKNSRTPVENKLASQLLQAYRESQGKPMVAGVNLEKIALPSNDNGNILVDINAQVDDVLLSALKSMSIQIVSSSAKYHGIRAYVAPAQLLKLASLSGVTFVKAGAKPHLKNIKNENDGLDVKKKDFNLLKWNNHSHNIIPISFAIRAERVKNYLKQVIAAGKTGTAVSQGDHTMKVDSAKTKYGFDGKGVKIGVISDSYNYLAGAATDVTNGELPGVGNPYGYTTPVTVVQDYTASGSDEGRAMLQIIHDLVPNAQLYFATAYNGDAGFASNIEALANNPNNCDVIVDDVGYSDEPSFQDGPIAQAVNYVTKKGVLYFSSAGNGGSYKYNYSSVWEGDFNPTTSTMTAFVGKKVHNFGTTAKPIIGDSIITVSGDYTLMWADPLGGSTNDYDLYLISNTGGSVIAQSTNVQTGTQDPFEEISPTTTQDKANYMLVIVQNTGAQNRALRLESHLDGQGSGMKHTTNGGTVGHPASDSAIGVAASDASKYYPNTFTTASTVENFSSDGPRRIFFNPDTTVITSGNFLYTTSGGRLLGKPNITAADGVTTNVTGTTSFAQFYGTSAAAPHAAAVAGLLKSARQNITSTQIKKLLYSTAIDIEAAGFDYNSGYGIVNALAAMDALAKTAVNNVITSFSPTKGNFGTLVTIKGIGLKGTTAVNFGATAAASFTIVNDSTITAVVGHGSSGNVSVNTVAGISILPGFTYLLSSINVTLNVDITNYLKAGNTVGANGIRISGNFTAKGDSALPNWSPAATNCALTKGTGNNWSIKVALPDTAIGSKLLYKFVNNDISMTEGVDLSSTILSGCGVSDAGGNVYRSMSIPAKDTIYYFCWDQCGSCNLTASLPSITTTAPSNITLWSATVGGNLNNSGGVSVIQEGVVYGTSANPNTQNSLYLTTLSPSLGNFTYNQTGLSPNTTYYVRAFAVNSIGTAYGSQYTYTTLPVIAKPTIVSFSPQSASKGSLVTIKGKNFIGVSSVSFGSTLSPFYTILNDSTLTAIVSTGSTGSIYVTNVLGTSSLTGFIFINNTTTNIASDYSVNGYFFHPASPRALSATKTITQVSANTYQTQLGDLGGSNYNFQFQLDSNNNLINWLNIGSTPAVPASGFMTADNPGNTAYTISPLPGQAPYVQSTYNNTYDPLTQTIYMHYGYAVGSSSQNGYTRQVYEKWTIAATSTGAPTITSITPTSGTSGTPILVRGTGFSSITNTYSGVTFGSSNAVNEADSIAILSDSVLVAWVGNGKSGSVYVTNSSGSTSITGFTYVKLPTITNSGWVNVGPAGFTNGTAFTVTSAIGKDNVPYIAYIDSATNLAIVMKYASNTWSLVGSAVSTGKATNLNLVLDKTNSPIVAFIDSTNAGAMTVKKFSANAWQTVGSGALTSVANYFSFSIDTNNVPYIFTGKAVYKLQNSVWNSVGSTSLTNAKYFYNITFDKTTNTPFIVFDSSGANGSPQASVMKYSGGNWAFVGPTTFTSILNGVYYLDIAIDNTGIPYVSFQEDNGFERASVYKYVNSKWSNVGSPCFTKGHIYNPSLALDKKNNPVLLYEDYNYNNSGTVMSFSDTSNWKIMGARGVVPNTYFTRHALSIDTSNAPLIVFYDQTQGGKASVLRFGTAVTQYSITGNIKNPLGTIIPTVTVTLNDTGKTVTSVAGDYGFTIASGNICKVIPSKMNDKNVTNGVNGTDISLIQSHILKKVLLNSPFKLIAGDVNNDGAVNGTDIALIKSFILKHITSFAGTRLWAFVDSSYLFTTPTKPFPYPDSINILKLNSNKVNQSFIGVKLGDVNYDWNAAVLGSNNNTPPIELFNDNISNSNANEVRVPIKVKNFRNIMGMQYTLNFNKDAFELKSIENNQLGADYNTDYAAEGKLPFLWVDAASEARTLVDSTLLFELVFTKKGNFTNEDIGLSSDITEINAFDGNYNSVGIIKANKLMTEGEGVATNITVYPNPVRNSLMINCRHINLVQLINNWGKVVKVVSLQDATNLNLSVEGLAKGVYHLRIQTLDGKVNRVGFIKE